MTQTLELSAPLSGQALPISQIPDPVFAGMMMGDGLAIDPSSNTLLAPCAGVITQIGKTNHALTLTADNGAEILMHIGIDTVSLKGQGFISRVRQGQRVETGAPLIEADFKQIVSKVPSLITAIVIANSDDYIPIFRTSGTLKAGETRFMAIAPRHATAASKNNPHSQNQSSLSGRAIIGHADGLHARPAALVQACAKNFRAQVTIRFNNQNADARSVVALLSLSANKNDTVEVITAGDEAAAALAAVINVLEKQSASAQNALAHKPTSTNPSPQREDGKFNGVRVSPGVAVGQIALFSTQEPEVKEEAGDLSAEYLALSRALATTREQITRQKDSATLHNDETLQNILAAHLALLDDPELINNAERAVGRGLSAGKAFRDASRAQQKILASLNNTLFAERANDLTDLERQVLLAISGKKIDLPQIPKNSILIASDLTPSDLTNLPTQNLTGIVLAQGGATSHAAILIRSLGIPALVATGPGVLRLQAGQNVLLDANAGFLDPQPGATALTQAKQDSEERSKILETARQQAQNPAQTLDGQLIEVAANIANAKDARDAMHHGADGIGLLRTEFLFIDRQSAPTRTEQQKAYQAVLDALQKKSAIIRTLDIGGDKSVPYLTLPTETNPALGLRGVRSGFAHSALLDDQLAALLATRPTNQLKILLPMITDIADLVRVKKRLVTLAAEMKLNELPQIGVMIEVPSAALLADQLAEHADFLSIGTNDLTQYTLARDRCQPEFAAALDPLHPAVLRLIAQTTQGAAKHQRWIGVCGAMASDLDATPILLGLGVTELSVSANLVPELKARVRSLEIKNCQNNTQRLLTLSSAEEIRQQARQIWPQK